MPRPSMTPEIREMYRAALQRLVDAGLPAKPQYHLTEDPYSLLTEGPRLPNAGTNESWKPRALYTSDSLSDNLASVTGDEGGISDVKNFLQELTDYGSSRDYVRVVPKPGYTEMSLPESQLKENWYASPTPMSIDEANALDATQYPGVDMLKVTDVDQTSGLTENLIRNPQAFSIFGRDRAWNPVVAGTLGLGALGLVATDSEASPFGPASKQTLKSAMELGLSSKPHDDAYKLAGRSFNFPAIGGKGEILDLVHDAKKKTYTLIVQGENGQRHEVPMTKDYFKLLMQSAGADEYLGNFALASKPAKDIQSSKSLTIREAKRTATEDVPHKALKAIETDAVSKIKEMSPELAKHYVFFKSAPDIPPVYIPRVYAEQLMRQGIGRITEEGPK